MSITPGLKERRGEAERRNKFQVDGEIKGEQVEKLRVAVSQSMGAGMVAKMFSNDFKLHIECVELFQTLINTQPDAITEILDLIFKWAAVRLSDSSNTKFAVAIFDFLAVLFTHLCGLGYQLQDFEAGVVVPLLCEKSGINNNILKDKVKKLIRMLFTVYDRQKTYQLMVQYGLNSKNLRAQAECLDELAEFIGDNGIDYSSEKEMKLVAKMADNADKAIRENALKFMGEVYKVMEENVWRVIGEVTPKVQGLLEQRFKKLKGGASGLQSSGS